MKRGLSIFLLLTLMTVSCTDTTDVKNCLASKEKIQIENDSLKNVISRMGAVNNQEIFTFLTFQKGNAEQAMNFYIDLFDNSKVVDLKRWGKEGPGKQGTIMHATFEVNGKAYMCSDSPPIHEWDFTPAVSNYVECSNENEIDRLFERLSENGDVKMPLNNYGFSKKFGWVTDQFGVSWQLNME